MTTRACTKTSGKPIVGTARHPRRRFVVRRILPGKGLPVGAGRIRTSTPRRNHTDTSGAAVSLGARRLGVSACPNLASRFLDAAAFRRIFHALHVRLVLERPEVQTANEGEKLRPFKAQAKTSYGVGQSETSIGSREAFAGNSGGVKSSRAASHAACKAQGISWRSKRSGCASTSCSSLSTMVTTGRIVDLFSPECNRLIKSIGKPL